MWDKNGVRPTHTVNPFLSPFSAPTGRVIKCYWALSGTTQTKQCPLFWFHFQVLVFKYLICAEEIFQLEGWKFFNLLSSFPLFYPDLKNEVAPKIYDNGTNSDTLQTISLFKRSLSDFFIHLSHCNSFFFWPFQFLMHSQKMEVRHTETQTSSHSLRKLI